MVRLDREPQQALGQGQIELLKTQVNTLLAQNPSVMVISDYAKGLLTAEFCQFVIQAARVRQIPLLVDPKGRDYSKYQGATALTPNWQETAEACGESSKNTDALLTAAGALRQKLALKFLAVTRSEEGISLFEEASTTHLPATAKQVFDVSGAGDTVIATLAAGLVAGLNPVEALQLANLAAGIVVGKVGTVAGDRCRITSRTDHGNLATASRQDLFLGADHSQTTTVARQKDRVYQRLFRPAACRSCHLSGTGEKTGG